MKFIENLAKQFVESKNDGSSFENIQTISAIIEFDL